MKIESYCIDQIAVLVKPWILLECENWWTLNNSQNNNDNKQHDCSNDDRKCSRDE